MSGKNTEPPYSERSRKNESSEEEDNFSDEDFDFYVPSRPPPSPPGQCIVCANYGKPDESAVSEKIHKRVAGDPPTSLGCYRKSYSDEKYPEMTIKQYNDVNACMIACGITDYDVSF